MSTLFNILSFIDEICESYQNNAENTQNVENLQNIRNVRNVLGLRNINNDINNNKAIISNIFKENLLMTEITSHIITNISSNISYNPIKSCLFSELEEKNPNINENCSICFESMKEKIVSITLCNHIYHEKCLNDWLNVNKTCPLCRNNL